jgi:PPOX class probable F420-dependent enzyme
MTHSRIEQHCALRLRESSSCSTIEVRAIPGDEEAQGGCMSSASSVLPDPSTRFGERVARRLRDEIVVWLTTVGVDGTPQPNPVWFLWDGDTFLIYNLAAAKRLEHIKRKPKVALHFDINGQGGDVVVIAGEAHVSPQEPPADQVADYVTKYGKRMAQVSGSQSEFAAKYSVALRIKPTKVRGF